jgi:hypothetical protein
MFLTIIPSYYDDRRMIMSSEYEPLLVNVKDNNPLIYNTGESYEAVQDVELMLLKNERPVSTRRQLKH